MELALTSDSGEIFVALLIAVTDGVGTFGRVAKAILEISKAGRDGLGGVKLKEGDLGVLFAGAICLG